MIYLIDDKNDRQSKLGWDNDKLKKFSHKLKTLYTPEEVSNHRDKIFDRGNIVLFHESFYDNQGHLTKNAELIRTDLRGYASNDNDFKVVFFSGSIKTRVIMGLTIAEIPVDVLYSNLNHYLSNNNFDLSAIVYGLNHRLEKHCYDKQIKLNNDLEEYNLPPNDSVFFVRTIDNYISNPFKSCVEGSFYLDLKKNERLNDTFMHDQVLKWFSTKKFEKIYIPLCFGPSLSDFNGLRFAFHIRITESINQGCPIYIYSYIDPLDLINNECFDILKLDDVQLIDYSHKAIKDTLLASLVHTDLDIIERQLQLVNLKIPSNLNSNHSIANIWAMHKWATILGDKEVQKNLSFTSSNLYFKFLKAKWKNESVLDLSDSFREIKNHPKTLLIDDEADKGWYNNICQLLCDRCGIEDIDYLGMELKSKTYEEIEILIGEKIRLHNSDIIILDLRLLSEDRSFNNIEEISGFKVLRFIKDKINSGIQILLFSATDNISNLLKLQKAGIDGFVRKTSLNSLSNDDSIFEFYKTYEVLSSRIFLKTIFNKYQIIKSKFSNYEYIEGTNYEEILKSCKVQHEVIKFATSNIQIDQPMTIALVFLSIFKLIEKVSSMYVVYSKEENAYIIGLEEVVLNRYNELFVNEGQWIPDSKNDKPSFFQKTVGLVIDYFELCNNQHKQIRNLWRIRGVRNYYLHNKKDKITTKDLELIVDFYLFFTSSMKE